MKKHNWIIGICNSASDGVRFFKFRGSKEEVKEQILSLVNQDRDRDRETWEYGCENVKDISVEENGYEMYGYGNYVDYHIDYTAKELEHIETISDSTV